MRLPTYQPLNNLRSLFNSLLQPAGQRQLGGMGIGMIAYSMAFGRGSFDILGIPFRVSAANKKRGPRVVFF